VTIGRSAVSPGRATNLAGLEAADAMTLNLGWGEIGIRLALSLFAGALIGINRRERGSSAGLRTTILVCLAASITMIEVNVLLPTAGKPATSFITMDLMRLPLGILSGIGFIGAGAIVRRGDLVEGVTTAATIWYVTVMGLCFGGGQLALGMAALAIAIVVLWWLKWVESRMGTPRRASLIVTFDTASPTKEEIDAALARGDFQVVAQSRTYSERGEICEVRYELRWHEYRQARSTSEFADNLARQSGVHRLTWRQVPAE
jgi:putative Mg2+ transporter-C (MgtC) family protein